MAMAIDGGHLSIPKRKPRADSRLRVRWTWKIDTIEGELGDSSGV
jgi:hypothetical protein